MSNGKLPWYTQSPWKADETDLLGRAFIRGKVGTIAIVCSHDVGEWEMAQEDGNVRLIEAAPEMFEAIARAVRDLETWDDLSEDTKDVFMSLFDRITPPPASPAAQAPDPAPRTAE